MASVTRILLVEDHAMVAEGLTLAASAHPALEVVGHAPALAAARQLAAELRPDVIVLDAHLPDGEGADAIVELKALGGGSKVLMVSGFVSDHALFRAIEAGVDGILEKSQSLDAILDGAERVANGESVFAPAMLMKVLRRSGSGSAPSHRQDLTSRELDVLELLAQGAGTDKVAETLHLSPNTVRNHISGILLKLGAGTRLEAVAIGIRTRLVDPPT